MTKEFKRNQIQLEEYTLALVSRHCTARSKKNFTKNRIDILRRFNRYRINKHRFDTNGKPHGTYILEKNGEPNQEKRGGSVVCCITVHDSPILFIDLSARAHKQTHTHIGDSAPRMMVLRLLSKSFGLFLLCCNRGNRHCYTPLCSIKKRGN